MRIGITCYPVYGGSGVVATELGKALAQRGHEIHFISYAIPFRLDRFTERIWFHEVTTHDYPLFEHRPYTLTLTSKMVDVAQHAKLDLLHVHYAIPHATSAVLARDILAQRGIHVPVVTTLHGTDITLVGQDPSFQPVVEHSINASDAVTSVSRYLSDETYARFNISKEIDVVPNFVDVDRFRPLNKSHFRNAIAAHGEFIMVHVSNFRPVKRAQDTVELLARLRGEGVAVKLLLVGDGPDRQHCECLARKRGVMEDVRFLGKQDPIEELLAVADVFLMPSGSETFGLAALEAMACGVPVIASNIGGLPELVQDGKSGYLVPLGDVDTMSCRVRELIRNKALRQQMGVAARERALEFRLDAIIPHYEAIYERLLVPQAA